MEIQLSYETKYHLFSGNASLCTVLKDELLKICIKNRLRVYAHYRFS